ncbi:hypothetical protein JHW43_002562 [Diplocarpon mali]|nr:hypothetical protein JHW43_002562 [Diplocarpon mali]
MLVTNRHLNLTRHGTASLSIAHIPAEWDQILFGRALEVGFDTDAPTADMASAGIGGSIDDMEIEARGNIGADGESSNNWTKARESRRKASKRECRRVWSESDQAWRQYEGVIRDGRGYHSYRLNAKAKLLEQYMVTTRDSRNVITSPLATYYASG